MSDIEIKIEEPIECPYCHTKDTEVISNGTNIIKNKIDFASVKIVCKNCGQISESVYKKDFEEYFMDKKKEDYNFHTFIN